MEQKNEVNYMFYIPKRVQVLVSNGCKAVCVCCGSRKYLSFDHIIPLSKDGKDCNSNGQILCKSCNNIKSDRLITLNDLKKEIKWY